MRKRKITRALSLLLLCCLLLGLSPVSRAASSKAGLALSTSHSGSTWTVTVKLTGGKKPNMIEFCLEYDSSLLKLKSVKAGSAFSSSNAPNYSQPKTGRVLFAWESLNGLKDGKLLVLTFSEKSGVYGTADVFFNEDYNTVVKDAEMNDIAVTLSDVEIEIEDPDDDWDEPYDPVRDDDDDDDDYDWDDDGDDDYDWNDDRNDDDDWNDDPFDPYDPYGQYDPDDPAAEPTPIPLGTDEPYSTPEPAVGETEYVMTDMVIKVGDVCQTQPGFLFLSSDNEVVTIEGGQLRGVSAGIAMVTAYQDGSAVGSCTITVEADQNAKAPSEGVNILSVVLWSGIGLIVIAMILIAVILIRRRRG